MTTMNERKKALEALLTLAMPLEQAKRRLAAFSWDAETEVAFVSLSHVAGLLTQFLSGRVSRPEVEDWANAVEGRDDLGFEPMHEPLVRELMHELANPLITQPLTRDRAMELLARIESMGGQE